uniref:Reticulon n=1 Tax=Electrophorus electricus TaxID=8005 RepID=A0AAY5EXZ1_ELEEL
MSVKPTEEPGLDGGWYGDDFQKVGRFGNTAGRFQDLEGERQLKGESGEQKHFNNSESNRQPLPVAMETASTDKSDTDLQKKSTGDMGDPYTSLLSNQNYSSKLDTSYFSGDLGGGQQKQPCSINDLMSSLESQSAMFSSDSGIEMTPCADLGYGSHKLHDPDKPSTYSYMDISGREGQNSPQRSPEDWGGAATSERAPPFGLGGRCYLEKSPSPVEVETLGPAAVLDSQTFPYVEEPSDDELSDYQPYHSPGTEGSASPIKITLTEMPPTSVSPNASPTPPVTVSEKDSILSLGLQGVPTVTLSEPEDESPGSSTPPLTESESPSDPIIQAGEVKTMSSTRAPPKQQNPSAEVMSLPSLPLYAEVVDTSSGDSGDSEIELVSEESSPQAPSSGYMSFSKSPSTSTPMHYSILREEREAELDSELALESCGEESPKRFPQDTATGKGRRADSRPAEPPFPSVATSTPTSPVPPPSAAATGSAPKEKSLSAEEKAKPGSSPAAPSTGLPELKVERPAGETHTERRRSSQSRHGSERHTALPAIFPGLTREKAMELLYWRDLKQTGLMFSSILLLLFSLTQFSVVSVIAYLALAALSATISFRVYKSVLQAVQKTDEGHPFKSYLEVEISLSHDQMQRYAENAQYYMNSTLKELRRLFLVQDLVDSLKFAVLMWLLTYVGALFNGLTLLIMAVVSMFSMPVVYEKYQAQIDQYLGLVRTQVNSVVGKIQEKIPGAKRKAE